MTTFQNLAIHAMPFTALVRRESLVTFRRSALLGVMLILFAALLFPFFTAFPNPDHSAALSAALAQAYFIEVALALWCGAVFVVPGLAAASVATERDRDTLTLLRGTLVSPRAFVIAKAANAAAVYLILVIAVLPVAAVPLFQVGVNRESVLMAIAVIVATVWAAAAIGVRASVKNQSVLSAVVETYVVTILLMGFLGFLCLYGMAVLNEFFYDYGLDEERLLQYIGIITPPYAMLSRINPGQPGLVVVGNLGYLVAIAVVMLAWAAHGVQQTSFADASDGSPPSKDQRTSKRPRLAPVVGAAMANLNPILRAEWLSTLRPSRHHGPVRIAVYAALMSIIPVGAALYRPYAAAFVIDLIEMSHIWFAAMAGMLAVFATIQSATLFTRDRDRGNLDLLRTTLLTPAAVVRGKFLTGIAQAGPLAFAAVVSGLTFVIVSERDTFIVVAGYAAVLLSLFVAVTGAMAVSAWSRSTPTAIITAVLLNAFTFVLVPMSIEAVLYYLDESGAQSGTTAMLPSPVLANIIGVEETLTYTGDGFRTGSETYYYCALAWPIQIAIAAALYLIAHQGYRRTTA